MYVFQELRDRLQRWVGGARFIQNARVRRYLLGGLFFALLTLIISQLVSPPRLTLAVGDLAPKDILAPRDVENRLATQRKRELAAAAVPTQRKIDPEVLRQAEEFINYVFQEIKKVRDLPNQDEATKVNTLALRVNLGVTIPNEVYAGILKLDDNILAGGQADALQLVRTALASMIGPEDVSALRDKIDQEATGYTVSTADPRLRPFVKELAKSRIRPNRVDDPEATKLLKQKAMAAEPPVIIKKGECCIIENHKQVTEDQYQMLQDLGMIGTRADFRAWVGNALLALVVVGLMGLYLARYRADILARDSKLILLGLIGIVTMLLVWLMHAFTDTLGNNVGYLMPVGVNAMLVAILLDPKVALLQSVMLALLGGMSLGADQINYTLVMAVGAVVGIYSVSQVESRTDIYRAGLLIAVANVATVIALFLMRAVSILDKDLWISAGLGALNGLIVAILVTGALPLFETLFGVVTPLKLLELSNPNHPLLKRLLVEAPGSYHHTILVANLSEAAAQAVGADQVLTRVGAYYHDIGKVKRPYFFVENQFGGENPHDKLPPSLSAMIITSHVKDGLEMAREARLPQEIIKFIPEHHGTMLVSYFYHMANKNGGSEYMLEEDFRYDGPKPQSKETAIVMLADGCEASVRAMRQKGPITVEQIEQQVKRITEDRLKQGQLDNCDLTLRELDIIQKTFVKMLSGVHHARIDYPQDAQAKLPAPAEAPAPQAEAPASAAGDGPEEGVSRADLDRERSGTDSGDGGAGGSGTPGDAAGA